MPVTTIYGTPSNGGVLSSVGTNWTTVRTGAGGVTVDTTNDTMQIKRARVSSKSEHTVMFGYVEFNTDPVPGDISAATVTVELMLAGGGATADAGTWQLEVSAGVLWTGGTLVAADWDYTARTIIGSLSVTGSEASNEYHPITIPYTAVNQSGITALMFRNDGFVANEQFIGDETENFEPYSQNSDTSQLPKIVVTNPQAGDWQFLGASDLVEVASGNLALTMTSLTGLAANDLLIAAISARGNAAFTMPSGWAAAATAQNSGNTTVNTTASIASGRLDYIVRGASDPALTWTRTGGNLGIGFIAAYRAFSGTPTLNVGNSLTMASGVTAGVLTSGLTTTQPNCLLVHVAAGARAGTHDAFNAVTDPVGASVDENDTPAYVGNQWVKRRDDATGGAADGAVALADAIKLTAGSTGDLTVNIEQAGRDALLAAAFYAAGGVSAFEYSFGDVF